MEDFIQLYYRINFDFICFGLFHHVLISFMFSAISGSSLPLDSYPGDQTLSVSDNAECTSHDLSNTIYTILLAMYRLIYIWDCLHSAAD